jgi:hypothetical protein
VQDGGRLALGGLRRFQVEQDQRPEAALAVDDAENGAAVFVGRLLRDAQGVLQADGGDAGGQVAQAGQVARRLLGRQRRRGRARRARVAGASAWPAWNRSRRSSGR